MLTIKTTDVHHKIWFHQPQHTTKIYKLFKLQKSLGISEPLKESSHGREYSKLYNLWSLHIYLNLTFLLLFFVFFLHKADKNVSSFQLLWESGEMHACGTGLLFSKLQQWHYIILCLWKRVNLSRARPEGDKLLRSTKSHVWVISKPNISETILQKNRIKWGGIKCYWLKKSYPWVIWNLLLNKYCKIRDASLSRKVTVRKRFHVFKWNSHIRQIIFSLVDQ